MGVYRRFICKNCHWKYYQKPSQCKKCGSEEFSVSSWIIRYSVGGKLKEESVPGINKTQARAMLSRRIQERTNEHFGIKKPKEPVLLKDFALGDYWLLYASQQKSPKTFLYRIRKNILPDFGDKYLDKITQKDILRFIAKKRLIYKVSTCNRILAQIKSIYHWAIEWKVCENNPAVGVKLKKENNEVLQLLTPEDFQRMIDCSPNWYTKAFIALGVGSLLRKNNLLALRWEHIDFDNKWITVPGTITKNQESVRIPMTDIVLRALDELPLRGSCKSDYILTNPKTGTRFKYIYHSFRKARDAAGISKSFTPHGLRHTGASWLIMSGVPTRSVMAWMNVKSESVLKRYVHLTPQHMAEEAQRFDTFFGERTGKVQDNKATRD